MAERVPKKPPRVDYSRILLLFVFLGIALVVFHFLATNVLGVPFLDLTSDQGRIVAGAIAAVTLLWVLRQVQTGGFQRVGQRVLVSRPNSDLKRLHQRVMSA